MQTSEGFSTRREFLASLARGAVLTAARPCGETNGVAAESIGATVPRPFFQTRGVVLVPDDLTLRNWPERAKRAGLTTIGLHHGASPKAVADFIGSDNGQEFLDRCRHLGLNVEYELHAARELMPRALFQKNPEFFRMNVRGDRTPDSNLCVHSTEGMNLAAENAVALAQQLRPTTPRYFYWGDDAKSWCHCPKCRDLSESDQALILENHLLAALRKFDSEAQLAHLAYGNTFSPPRHVRPKPGIFLEFAPINRRYDIPYRRQTGPEAKDALDALDANLAIFGRGNAQVLEYWLDVSRFSKWKKPAVRLPWNENVFADDLDAYAVRGIRHVTSFAVFIDADYVRRHGEPEEVNAYGEGLHNWQPGQ